MPNDQPKHATTDDLTNLPETEVYGFEVIADGGTAASEVHRALVDLLDGKGVVGAVACKVEFRVERSDDGRRLLQAARRVAGQHEDKIERIRVFDGSHKPMPPEHAEQ